MQSCRFSAHQEQLRLPPTSRLGILCSLSLRLLFREVCLLIWLCHFSTVATLAALMPHRWYYGHLGPAHGPLSLQMAVHAEPGCIVQLGLVSFWRTGDSRWSCWGGLVCWCLCPTMPIPGCLFSKQVSSDEFWISPHCHKKKDHLAFFEGLRGMIPHS